MLKNFFPLYRYLRGFIITALPILLILFSISIRLPDTKLHKDTLKNSSFYTDLSTELKTYEPGFDAKSAFNSLVISSTIDEFASPGWLQNFSEKNIDLTTAWLRGDAEDWTYYLPSQDINLAVTDKIDAKTKDFNTRYSGSIPACSETQQNQLKNNGFDSSQDFCLPESVKNGQQTLSEFFNYDKNNANNKSILDSLLKSSGFNGFSDNFKFDNILQNSDEKEIYFWAKTLRGYFLWLRNSILSALILTIILIIFLLLLAKGVEKKALPELRRILTYSGYRTIISALGIILVVGGSAYLTSSLKLSLLPGFSTAKIASIISWQITLFSFNLVSTAIYIALALFVISIGVWIVDKIGFLNMVKKKNQKLANKPTNNLQNRTLDGQFQRANVITDPSFALEFQNKDIAENFEMPLIRDDYKSVTFNYDVLAKRKPTTVIGSATKPEQSNGPVTNVEDDYSEDADYNSDTNNTIDPNTNGPKKDITWF